jgi:hypothetical protein
MSCGPQHIAVQSWAALVIARTAHGSNIKRLEVVAVVVGASRTAAVSARELGGALECPGPDGLSNGPVREVLRAVRPAGGACVAAGAASDEADAAALDALKAAERSGRASFFHLASLAVGAALERQAQQPCLAFGLGFQDALGDPLNLELPLVWRVLAPIADGGLTHAECCGYPSLSLEM